MTTRAAAKSKNKKPLETTLGRAPLYSSDDPIDLSHVRKPIDTSIFGLSQVLTLFETATDEVRRYVTYECDIMYECRMCRTIFRSLANFILHKRNYCRESYNQNDHINCRNSCQENEFHVLQEDADIMVRNYTKKQDSREGSPVPPKCDSKPKQVAEVIQPDTDSTSTQPEPKDKKNLSSVLCRLLNKQESTLITEQCLAEDISDDSKSSDREEAKNNVTLQTIADSSSGVFQTMFRNMIEEHSKMDFMKTEVMEIHDILENNEAILDSDGKIVTSEAEKSRILRNNFMCTVCNQKFSTKKTLTYHINYKHNNTRQVYQCPECEDTFANAWGVFRHLYKIHRKTPAQVKRLRNQIHANRIRKDEQPEQKDANNVKTASVSSIDFQGRLDLENQQWMDDLEGDNDLQRCGGCGRKFERKAALHSHSQFCTKRIAVCNTIKENSAKRVQTEEKSERKISKVAATNADDETNGARRRKPLIAQRLCRIDYFKENQKMKESSKTNDSNITSIVVKDNSQKEDESQKIHVNEHKTNDIIELLEDNDNAGNTEDCSEIEEIVTNLVSSTSSSKSNMNTNVVSVCEQKSLILNNERCASRNNIDDRTCMTETTTSVIVNNAKSCSTVEENADIDESCIIIAEKVDSTKNCAATMENSIVTRSKSGEILNLGDDNSVPTNEVISIIEDATVTDTIQNCAIALSEPCTNTEPAEGKEISSHTEPQDIYNETVVDVIQVNSKSESTNISNENSSDMKFSSDTENAPQRNTIQVRCIYMQQDIAAEGKRKISDVKDPLPQNSKRKKLEGSLEVFSEEVKQAVGNNSKITARVTLETKSIKYINKEKRFCLPCKKVFKSYKSLIRHMAVHFNWYRYQCRSCQFMSYNKSRCDRHAEKNHGAHDEVTLKNFVLHIPVWKTVELSTDFTERCKKHRVHDDKPCKFEDTVPVCSKEGVDVTKVQKDLNLASILEEQTLESCTTSASIMTKDEKSHLPNTQDPSVRKMIMEVIFGSDVGSLCQSEVQNSLQKESRLEQKPEVVDNLFSTNEVQPSADNHDPVVLKDSSRPVRNRTAPVQKDFLYDMKHILKPKSAKEKDISTVDYHKECLVKKQKPLKIYMRKSKPKLKKPAQLTSISSDIPDANKSVPSVPQSNVAIDLAQDINMNSKDSLKQHITGDCV